MKKNQFIVWILKFPSIDTFANMVVGKVNSALYVTSIGQIPADNTRLVYMTTGN